VAALFVGAGTGTRPYKRHVLQTAEVLRIVVVVVVVLVVESPSKRSHSLDDDDEDDDEHGKTGTGASARTRGYTRQWVSALTRRGVRG
jgi:hypothetical protein